MKSLEQLADILELKFKGDGEIKIVSVATLDTARANQISFLSNPKYKKQLKTTQAAVVIMTKEHAEQYKGNVLLTNDPYVVFAKTAQLFDNKPKPTFSIHHSAVIDETAKLHTEISVGPHTVIGKNTTIEANCIIENLVSIGDGVRIGKGSVIKSGVKIENRCQIGQRVIIHPGAVIGADGFGLARDKNGWVKIPQTGRVKIGNDCEIGANTTIDRGAINDTILGNDVRLDNQIQIGHNVKIGDYTVIAGCTAVAGSAIIGKNCMIGGGVGIVGHIEICDAVTVQAMALVSHSIKKSGSYSSVTPLQSTDQWRKNAVRFR
ncbi:MAG: UDP-3-O-(3-hydroxymyristoyl)glucosamine N-acyltransferase [Proteobacteria bacterium]|nr:UDP-3-O-(3-hydroxymyristoyl)glucosamine N-acyltransferase [Pseudomonadota bacterium]